MFKFHLRLITLFVFIAIYCSLQSSSLLTIKRARYPSLSPDAAKIAFAYQGDIWVVNANGGKAERLTIHPAVEMLPKWSPDGKWIAFSSNRHGSNNVFVMDARGGAPKRLTFSTSGDMAMGWTPDSRWILFTTNRWGSHDVMKVHIDGGEPIRLTWHAPELEFTPSVSYDGKKVAYCHGGGLGNWRRSGLRGSATADIWIADFTSPVSNMRNITNDEVPQLWPMWSPDDKFIYYVGDDGTLNLWRMDSDGKNQRKLTNYTADRVRYPAMSFNGKKIAYEYQSEVFVYDIDSAQAKKISIQVPADQRYNDVSRTSLTSASDYAVAPNAKRLLVVSRGEILMTPESGGATRRMTEFIGRDEDPMWINDTEFLYVTLQNKKKDIYKMDINGNAKPFIASKDDEMAMALSPDGKTLAFHRGWNEICIVPIEGGEPKVIKTGFFNTSIYGTPRFSWAPDNKHIVYATSTERGGHNIEVVNIKTGTTRRIGLVAKNCSTPLFTPDGKKIVFTANEFPEGSDLFVIDLVHDSLTFTEDALDKIDEKKEEEKKPDEIQIEMNGIFERMRRLTNDGNTTSCLPSPDSKSIYFVRGGEGGFQIHRISVTGGSAASLTSGGSPKSNMKLSKDGKTLYFLEGGRVSSIPATGGNQTARSFSLDIEINQHEEARALFDEIGWVISRIYYDPKHRGIDWNAVLKYYEGLLPHAYDRAEFYDLMLEMIMELNSSHLGVSGPTQQPRSGDDSTSIIGVEPDWLHLERTGQYRIAYVLPASPADHPDSKLNKGDTILRVDGVLLSRSNTFDTLLNNKSGKRVILTVQAPDGTLREVRIKPIPLGAQSELLYNDMVRKNRELVDKYSNGKFAYVHIEGMNTPSHNQFMREVRTLTQNKQGLIIDVRYNGGGFTAHLALGMLIKRPWLIRTPRGGETQISENLYRGDSVEIPSALMINQSSFSNAEILAEGFRRLGIGPIIGVPTAGGVIGTGGWSLFDGGSLRTPTIGAFTIDGEDLEGNGRKPDYHVPYDPNAIAKGEDPMLKKAVEVLQALIK